MDLRKLKTLIDLVSESNISELEITEAEGKVIKSPMVGTFYRSATPGGKPFTDVGDEIKEGQPVCIIEAMKIMNEIEADVSGRVARILVENGQAVEFGQPLFIIE
jgi:acetyl-CoA carboxylase biotin carboxyl carrier protein